MSTAEVRTSPQRSPEAAKGQIQGRLDAIESRRLYGWVWDRGQPEERLLVRVLFRGRMVASATADRPRIDLRRNGIGDGAHAFEVELPDGVGQDLGELEVVAVSRRTGEEIVLPAPSRDERVAEAAISAPLNRVLQQLEVLIAAQHRSQVILREAVEAIRETAGQVERMASQEDGIGAALEVVRSNHGELAQRIADVEVFHMRFDKMIAGFDERIAELANAADRPMRRAVAILIALAGISAASAVSTLMIALR
ncbi:hypothetical protein [Microvirga thermotolerans]|uniref:Uncharacterized protein n=1 Tax=Microvirga thermotolerans TaxID=2651334 RepID=A0A5P9JXN2_9HYPH|nr:hypothetical protein [Microvirga thermotolerans]QFU17183.1 hypothetical protein GDR74_13670 [Microvirga thermotolerans]